MKARLWSYRPFNIPQYSRTTLKGALNTRAGLQLKRRLNRCSRFLISRTCYWYHCSLLLPCCFETRLRLPMSNLFEMRFPPVNPPSPRWMQIHSMLDTGPSCFHHVLTVGMHYSIGVAISFTHLCLTASQQRIVRMYLIHCLSNRFC